METAAHTHDGVATVTGTLGVQASKLHRTLIGLGAGVGKERLPYLLARRRSAERGCRGLIAGGNGIGNHVCTVHVVVSELGQQRRDLATLLDVEVVRHMQKLFGLRLKRRKHCRITVA